MPSGRPPIVQRQEQGQRQGKAQLVEQWRGWRQQLKAVKVGGMELERFGLCLAGVVLAMPGELSGAMKAAMKGMGVTDFSEATSQVTKDLLPLPMGLSAEEQDWIKWASGPSFTISRKWIQVRAASRRVWLWLVVFSLNLFHCGALNSAVRPGAMYATGPVSSPQAKALASLQDAVDFFLLPADRRNEHPLPSPDDTDFASCHRLPDEDWTSFRLQGD